MNKVSMRLQTPVDSQGNRTDIHVITSTDEVLVDPSSETPSTLTEKIEEMDNLTEENKYNIDNLNKGLNSTNQTLSTVSSNVNRLSNDLSNTNEEVEGIKEDKSGKLVLSATQPNYACVWGKILS